MPGAMPVIFQKNNNPVHIVFPNSRLVVPVTAAAAAVPGMIKKDAQAHGQPGQVEGGDKRNEPTRRG